MGMKCSKKLRESEAAMKSFPGLNGETIVKVEYPLLESIHFNTNMEKC